MADRDRSTSAQGGADEGFLRRWSRRKTEARSAATATSEDPSDAAERAPASPERAAEPEQAALAPVDPKDLPDIESLDASSDYTVFMRPGVPLELRNQALRKLWRSDPLLANLDGLLEYGEDYTIPSWPKGTVSTAYRIGRGFVTEIEKLGAAGDQPAIPQQPVTGRLPETGKAVAAPDPKPAADAPADPPQPSPESTGSDAAETASPPAEAGVSTKRRARPLPRRG
jgi:hypothetical protein